MDLFRTVRLLLFIAAAAALLAWCAFDAVRRRVQEPTPEQEQAARTGLEVAAGGRMQFVEGHNPFDALRSQMEPQPNFQAVFDAISATIQPTSDSRLEHALQPDSEPVAASLTDP